MIDIQHEKEATLHVNVHNENSLKRKDMNKMSLISIEKYSSERDPYARINIIQEWRK